MPDTKPLFQDARVVFSGHTVVLTAEECLGLANAAGFTNSPGYPSTWLAVDVFRLAQRKLFELPGRGAPDAVVLTLAAAALGISVDKLTDLIRWNENYMRWHDGDDSYSVLAER